MLRFSLFFWLLATSLSANAFSESLLKTPRLEQAALCGALSARMVEIEEQYALLDPHSKKPLPRADLLVWVTARELLFKTGFALVDEGALSADDMAEAMDSRLPIIDILDTRQRNLILERCHELRGSIVLPDKEAIPKAMANTYELTFKRSLVEDAEQSAPALPLLTPFPKPQRSVLCLRSATRIMETVDSLETPLAPEMGLILGRSVVLFGRMVWLTSDVEGESTLSDSLIDQAEQQLSKWTPTQREHVFNECYAFSGTLDEVPLLLDEDFKHYAIRLFKEKTVKN